VNNISIADAIEIICELSKVLDDAYWEANSCDEKDQIYNLASILNTEYIEISKMSVQDHHFEYEVISVSKEALKQALTLFQQLVPKHVHRQITLVRLNALLHQLIVALT
jgi:hypothetical protein